MYIRRLAVVLAFATALLGVGCNKCFHRQPAAPAPCGCAPGSTLPTSPYPPPGLQPGVPIGAPVGH